MGKHGQQQEQRQRQTTMTVDSGCEIREQGEKAIPQTEWKTTTSMA